VAQGIRELNYQGFPVSASVVRALLRYHDRYRKYPRQVLLPRGWHLYTTAVPELLTIDKARRILRKIGPAIKRYEMELLAREERERLAREFEKRSRQAQKEEDNRRRREALLRRWREREQEEKRRIIERQEQEAKAEKEQLRKNTLRELIKSFDGDLATFKNRFEQSLGDRDLRTIYSDICATRQVWRNGFSFVRDHVIATSAGLGVVERALDPHPALGRSLVQVGPSGKDRPMCVRSS
jgi:hypothetical protein